MGPEAKFYQQIKRNLKEFSLIRRWEQETLISVAALAAQPSIIDTTGALDLLI